MRVYAGISRRAFVRASAATSISMGALRAASAQTQAKKPNIIFILADDMGFADLSCYGQQDYTTPNIDRIAIEGLKFWQAYANSSVCSATRTALITGRYQYRLPVGLEEPINASTPDDIGLQPEHPTLPSLLKKVGYRTALVGKWHLGPIPKFGPTKSGYDEFFGIPGGAADYFNHGAGSGRSGAEASRLYEGDVPVEKHGYMTNLLGDRAVQTVEAFAKAQQPFFLSLHFTAPHWPWEGPGDEEESKRIKSITHRDGGTQKTYAAMVQSLDSNVGRVLQAIDANGIADDTIVIFTSDNGGERFAKTWPFTGMKQELLEGGLRIPAVIRWPRRVAAGITSQQVMITMDWVPTLLAAAGAATDPAFPPDGEDLGPALSGQPDTHPRKLLWRYKAGTQRAIRDGDWKYLLIAGNEFLFDVVKDPRERANLKDRYKDVFNRLKNEWEVWNASMLPERPRPAPYAQPGNLLADHYGVVNPPATAPAANTVQK